VKSCAAKAPQRPHRGAVLAIMLLACLAPAVSAREPLQTLGVNVRDLRERMRLLREQAAEIADPHDLLDSLHFGWFDRPYARATAGILMKTLRVLDREAGLRERGNGAIGDRELADVLSWSERSLAGVRSWTSDAGFRPHRVRVGANEARAPSSTPALFAFVDRATSTRHDDAFGDLDLLAAMGLRLYARDARDVGIGDECTLRESRARALGIATLAVRCDRSDVDGGASDSLDARFEGAGSPALFVEGLTLKEMLERRDKPSDSQRRVPAIVDPPAGESYPASLARRALARGALGGSTYVVAAWRAPLLRANAGDNTRSIAAAMWLHAIDGQSVGLLEGWRDLRDGSINPYPSVLTSPDTVETVARTALDILRHGAHIRRMRADAPLLLIVSGNALDPRDENVWAPWTEQLWAELVRRQIRFDVAGVSALDESRHRRYAEVLRVEAGDTADLASLMIRIERGLAQSPQSRRVTVRRLDGRLAGQVYARYTDTAPNTPNIAVVNLSGSARHVRLDFEERLDRAEDVISGELIDKPAEDLPLNPWQVRLLRTPE